MSKNNLHWNLDDIFKVVHQEKRPELLPAGEANKTAIENSNLIAKFAITMLNQEKTHPKSKSRKRLKAFADDTYRD